MRDRSPRERAAIVGRTDKYGRTPLCLAAMLGSVELVNFLLDECGVEVGQALQGAWWQSGRTTPLFCAASEGQLEVVRTLIERGADVNDGSRGQYNHLTPILPCILPCVASRGSDLHEA